MTYCARQTTCKCVSFDSCSAVRESPPTFHHVPRACRQVDNGKHCEVQHVPHEPKAKDKYERTLEHQSPRPRRKNICLDLRSHFHRINSSRRCSTDSTRKRALKNSSNTIKTAMTERLKVSRWSSLTSNSSFPSPLEMTVLTVSVDVFDGGHIFLSRIGTAMEFVLSHVKSYGRE